MEESIASLKGNCSRLVNLIDLQTLKPELQRRPVLIPFLQNIKTGTSSNIDDVGRLLDFICDSGQSQAVSALIGALKAETTHPGHEEAYKLLLSQTTTDSDTQSISSRGSSSLFSDVLWKCIVEIEKTLDFASLIPLLLQRGLITQNTFTSMQAAYITRSENAQSIVKAIIPLGVQGVIDFISVLQTIPSESHELLIDTLKTKIQEIVADDLSVLPDDQYDMLIQAGIIDTQLTSTSTTSYVQSIIVTHEKKDRIAIIISMETYYDKENVFQCVSTRLSSGQLLSERRAELEQLYKELGCTVINITEDINDCKIDNDDIIQDIFLTKVNGLCCKNTVVCLCILGCVYPFKVSPCGTTLSPRYLLLLGQRDGFINERQSHATKSEHQIAKAIFSLPTQYINVIVEGIFDNYDKNLYSSISPWQSLCPWNSRVVVYYTQPFVGHNETFDDKKQSAGTLSNIILLTLKRWKQRGQLPNTLTHNNIFSIINAQWSCISHCVPCIKGDIDRIHFGPINKPMPFHFMGEVSTDDYSKIILSAGTSLGLRPSQRVKLYHIFAPEEIYDGIIDSSSCNISTIVVTQIEQWSHMLTDIKQNDMDAGNGLFVIVYLAQYTGDSTCVDIQVDDASDHNELSTFVNDFSIFKRNDVIKIRKIANEYIISSNIIQTLPSVISIQVAKSLLKEPLLSKDGLRKSSFDLFSSISVIGHGPECALCSSEEDGYWSPNIKEENPYWHVSFAQNIFMKSIEVRGSPYHPHCIPDGYKIMFKSRVMLCDGNGVVKSRFEIKSKHITTINLKCIDPFSNTMTSIRTGELEDEIFTMIITPLVGSSGIPVIGFKLTYQTDKNDVVLLQYGLENATQYDINHKPSVTNDLILLPSSDDWLVLKYPTCVPGSITLQLLPGLILSKLLLYVPEGYLSEGYETPKLIQLEIKSPWYCSKQVAAPPLTGFYSERLSPSLSSGSLIPCCDAMIQPIPSSQTNMFHKCISLQTQFYGYTDLSDLTLYENEYIQVDIQYSTNCVLYLVILCIEDTGNIVIIDTDKLLPKNTCYYKLIDTFMPKGYTVAKDCYTIIITSSALHLPSLEQNQYYSVVNYNSELTTPIEQDNREYWYTCNYKVTVKKERHH